MNKKYYLGLDVGTNSVGWAVTDENYKICRFNKKDMWGIRLFESASTAEERRLKRGSRRRIERRNDRIKLLQEIFAEEIDKVDPAFFIRLNESRLYLEDKSIQEVHPLFNDKEFSDKEYYKQYPTIFHLRKELVYDSTPHDPRLVYLAIHHILKNRGHFLVNGNFADVKDFKNILNSLLESIYDTLGFEFYVEDMSVNTFEEIIRNKKECKTTKQKKLIKLIKYDEDNITKETQKLYKNSIEQICKFITGGKGDVYKLIGHVVSDIEVSSFTFAESKYEEIIRDNLEQVIPDECALIDQIKLLYDWSILSDILGNKEYISVAKVESYEKHNKNIKVLHQYLKKYCSKNVTNLFFNNIIPKKDVDESEKKLITKLKAANYASYIGSVKSNGKQIDIEKCSEEDFYKSLKAILETIIPDQEDEEIADIILQETELQSLLPLQRNKDNGVVPKQIHEVELNKILENASKYLTFLNQKDEEGYIAKEKILSIFNYKIPYYVGPLSDRHKQEGANAWIVRKKPGRIYPWNFTEMVDLEKSNEEFINRMTNKCTYLVGEDVLPQNSILYSKYKVLNELNNLKIKGTPISVELKQNIFHNLFMKKRKVTVKNLVHYLNELDPGIELTAVDLSGFDQEFKASYASYIDFQKNIFGDKIEEKNNVEIAENIIKWITIYGDDKEMLKNVIRKNYPQKFTKEQMKAISKLKYTGWGNFSYKFLRGIKACDLDGVCMGSIMDGLWNTNNNLMQLLSGKYTYKTIIDEYNAEKSNHITKINYENVVQPLTTSPANKRAIWQTVQIVEEIKKVMGCEPDKIFVEMARGRENQKEENRKKSRKEKLLELYNSCEEDMHEWIKEIEDKDEREFSSTKLYLYYTQMGKCMYTQEKIDLDELMQKNSKWDKDHIYPQSKIKDDSLDNLVLVNKNYNSKKSNELLSYDIVKKQRSWWETLRRKKFITQKKYDRLTRTNDFTDDELSGFISRQLVETRQSCRLIAEIFKSLYRDSNVVYVKAGLVSQFRKKQLNVLKSRLLNDYHHAKDAYLNIVVGNVYNVKFTSNPVLWIRENRNTNYSINRVFDYDVIDRKGNIVWKAPLKDDKNKPVLLKEGGYTGGTIDQIRKIVQRNNILYTEYTYSAKGALFNETIAKKDDNPKVKLKKDLDTSKYGGYKSASTSYFSMIEFEGKKGQRTKQIVGVPIYIANRIFHDPNILVSYYEENLGLKNVKIIKEKIKKNSLMIVDGFPMRIRGENERDIFLKGNMQLVLDNENSETIRAIEKYLEKNVGFEPDPILDGIDHEKLNQLYDVLNKKLKTVYKERPSNISEKLDNCREIFVNLNLREKSQVVREILNSFRCDNATISNLKLIGGSAYAGKMVKNKNTLVKSKLKIINQSVTGLFEN